MIWLQTISQNHYKEPNSRSSEGDHELITLKKEKKEKREKTRKTIYISSIEQQKCVGNQANTIRKNRQTNQEGQKDRQLSQVTVCLLVNKKKGKSHCCERSVVFCGNKR